MATVSAKYLGGLRCECVHNQSGTKIITDAPSDNKGQGQSFSPTDLFATALGGCAMTTMGIFAQMHNIDLSGMSMEITKTMSANPRRVAKIEVVFAMPDRPFSEKEKKSVEHAARFCPVHLSIHPEVEQVFTFNWPQ